MKLSVICTLLLTLCLPLQSFCLAAERDLAPQDVNILLNFWMNERPGLLDFYLTSSAGGDTLMEAAKIMADERTFAGKLKADGVSVPAVDTVLTTSSLELLYDFSLREHFERQASAEDQKEAQERAINFIGNALGEDAPEVPFTRMKALPGDLSTVLFRFPGEAPFTVSTLFSDSPSLSPALSQEHFQIVVTSHLRTYALRKSAVRSAVSQLEIFQKLVSQALDTAICDDWRRTNALEPSEVEIKEYYRRNSGQFLQPPLVWAQILEIEIPPSKVPALEQLVMDAREQEKPFGWILEELKQSYDVQKIRLQGEPARRGGNLFERVWTGEKPGRLSLYATHGDAIIFFIERSTDAQPVPFVNIKESIRNILEQQAWKNAWSKRGGA